MLQNRSSRTFIGAFFFGMGLAGMLDGIVFHQLLQWHSTYMWTSRYYQIVSDGLLHILTTLLLVIGALILWTATYVDRRAALNRFLVGLFTGAGTFNLVEGVVDHHILQIHHVLQGSRYQLQSDLAFDAFALLLLLIGGMLHVRRP